MVRRRLPAFVKNNTPHHRSGRHNRRSARLRKLCFAGASLFALAGIVSCSDSTRESFGTTGIAHYSSLDQINTENVHKLREAWRFDTGDAFPGSQLQGTPVEVDGVLYLSTPKLNVIALDGATGRQLWRYDPNGDREVRSLLRNRAVTYWSDGRRGRIFIAVRHEMHCLDAATGKLVPEFGGDGKIDLREGLDRAPETQSVTLTSPGVVFEDLLIVGSSVGETLPSPYGDIRAYDVRDGVLKWSFHTVPRPADEGYHTWPKDAWLEAGGANAWSGLTLDQSRGLVFAATGSPTPDFYGASRVGDNLFGNSVIALNARSGRKRWHYQIVRHDLWDRDLPAPPSLVQVKRDGQTIDAIAQVTKAGDVFVLDRDTGQPLFPVDQYPAPASVIPGEIAATFQPVPRLPKALTRQQVTLDQLTDRTPEAHASALERFRQYRSERFAPPSLEGTLVMPTATGGASWGGGSYDPETNHFYVNVSEGAFIARLRARDNDGYKSVSELYINECASCHGEERKGNPPDFPSLINLAEKMSETELLSFLVNGSGRMPSFARLGMDTLMALNKYLLVGRDTALSGEPIPGSVHVPFAIAGYDPFLDPDGYPAVKPPWGTLNAIDLNTGERSWRVLLGEYPKLKETGYGPTGSENIGGSVVTAGGLLFIGATHADRKFRAFDKKTGEVLWETVLPAGGNATPLVYQANGRQFVIIAAGGRDGFFGYSDTNIETGDAGSFIAFALPE